MERKSTTRGKPRGGFTQFLRSGARDERGAVAVFFAVALVVLTPLVLGALDIYMLSIQRSRLQDALDAAALYVARSTATDPHQITTIGQQALDANIKLIPGAHLHGSSFELVGNKIVAQAVLEPTSIASNLWSHGNMTVGTDVVRSSMNLEVAMVLDITGSMDDPASGGGGKKIDNLKVAASDLIDIVVQPTQTPYYSKVAVVPYSNSVNVGTYADTARGAVVTKTFNITGATWVHPTLSARTVSGATRANPVVITTSANHGYSTGDSVYISGVGGMTQLNGKAYTITKTANNKFSLNGVNGSSYSSFSSNGTSTPCASAGCAVTVTVNSNTYADGGKVFISGVGGITNLNNKTFVVSNRTSSTVTLVGSLANGATYTSGGTAACRDYGCQKMAFVSVANAASGAFTTFDLTNCATERTGADAFTDAGFSSPVGAKYQTPTPTNPDNTICPSSTISPMSTDKVALKAAINSYSAVGFTAGHIGLAWGWYMVSPNFNTVWPAGSRGAPYAQTDVMKVVILMTDGQFNTANADGVISKDSTSAGTSSRINTDAPNGSSFVQAKKLCDEMKKKKIIIYTVGFDIGTDASAIDVMNYCATDPQHVYLPTSGTAIKTAFKAIGQDINSLRLAH